MDYKTFSKEIIEKVNAIEAIIETDTPNNPDPPVAIQNSAEFSAKESIPDYGTVSILIEKLNATKEIIKTAAPNKPAFSVAIRNYAEIEKTLRQSGLIQLDGQWVYPATGWRFQGSSRRFYRQNNRRAHYRPLLTSKHRHLKTRYARKQSKSSQLQ